MILPAEDERREGTDGCVHPLHLSLVKMVRSITVNVSMRVFHSSGGHGFSRHSSLNAPQLHLNRALEIHDVSNVSMMCLLAWTPKLDQYHLYNLALMNKCRQHMWTVLHHVQVLAAAVGGFSAAF